MATPLEDFVANMHSPSHTGFIMLMPWAGLPNAVRAALMLGGG